MQGQMEMGGLSKLLWAEYWERGLPPLTERESSLPADPNKAVVITGMRRSGKTFRLHQEIRGLIARGVEQSRIFYVNFEDDRILPAGKEELAGLIEGFYALYPDNHHRLTYIFLDEIQNVSDWPLVVRRFIDTRQVQFYLTGSSAKLLSKEIATSLRGRALTQEIWPFSFREFLNARQFEVPDLPHGPAVRDGIAGQLREYLSVGGFPEVIQYSERQRIKTLQDYVSVVIFRDIVERHDITSHFLVRHLIKTLLNTSGRSFSVNKFYKDLKSQGVQASKNTIHEYLGYIEDTYLSFAIQIFADSVRKRQVNPRKCYAVDPGLVAAYSFRQSDDLGPLFENLVYLDLRRRENAVSYYITPSGYEIDFVAEPLSGQPRLIQAAYSARSEEVLAREYRALREAESVLGIKGTLVTMDNYLEWVEEALSA